MILAIDMGNSNIVVGGIDDKRTYFEERITTDDRKTSLEYAIMLKNILEIHRVKRGDIEGSILSSVVPPLNAPLSSAVKKITGKRPLLVGSGMKTGLNIKMDNPKAVGGDRIVAAVAAIARYEGPIIIIDMGTATTMDVVDRAGSYIGGVILPGVNVALNSLVSHTAQLPRINLDVPRRVIGKNTVECMRNGIMLGNAATLDGLIDRMEAELGESATLVSTGGMARFITPLCRHSITYDPDLLLRGLWILYRQNTAAGVMRDAGPAAKQESGYWPPRPPLFGIFHWKVLFSWG